MKDWFKKRWDNLGEESLREILKVAAPRFKDPDVYLQELILDEENEKIADKRLCVLEGLLQQSKASKMEVELERVRIERDRMLALSDFSQLPDVPLTNGEKKAYRQYRRYLRELPVLIERGQVTEFKVMDFKAWEHNKPIFEGSDK